MVKRRIPEPKPGKAHLENRRLQFTFKSFDENHPKFKLESCTTEFLYALLLQLKNYSEYTEEQFREQNNQDHRHTNYWKDTSEPNGFTHLSEEIQDDYCWQFAICPKSRKPSEVNWRVHGMLLDNIFHIVWFDPTHKLAPHNSRHGSDRKRRK